MRKTLLLSLLFFLSLGAKAQLTVDNSLTPDQLVQNILAGSGVQVSNVTFTGALIQIGSFNGQNSNIGFGSGIILSSGDISTAIGPNDQGGAGGSAGGETDPDLEEIVDPNGSFDAAILEFDFIPISDTIKFNYVFASEEYMEYVNSGVNDAFGFFISGPGINGPFTNNAENIALIPGTTTPVTIDNLNDDSFDQFYVNNEDIPGETVQYDGFSVPLQAIFPVQCGQTYHLKLAISDAGDDVFDSGVFLEAGSLSSIGVNIDLQTVTGEDIIYESCTPAQFVFSRPASMLADSTIVNYQLTGTAQEGVDYDFLQDTIIFVPGEDTVAISLNAFQDNIDEGDETVIVTATYVSDCGDTITVTTNLTLSEDPIFGSIKNAPIVFCPSDSVEMTLQAIGGTPPYTYTWSNGETGDTVTGSINGLGTVTYYVEVVDFCGFIYNDSVIVTQLPPPSMTLNVDAPDATCIEDSVLMSAFASGGVEPLDDLTWSNGGTGNFVYGLTAGFPTYTVTATDACNNTIQETVTIQPAPDPVLNIIAPDKLVQCPDDEVILTAIAGNGFEPYSYLWSNGTADDSTMVAISTNGVVTFQVTATDICGNTVSDNVTLTMNQTLAIDSLTVTPASSCLDNGATNSFVSGETGPINYNWSGPGSSGGVISSGPSALNLGEGWYYLTVTDNVCVAVDSIFVEKLDPPVANFSIVTDEGPAPQNMTFSNSSQNADTFEWDFGNGDEATVTTLDDQSSLYPENQSYTVTLVAYQQSCADSMKLTFELIALPSYITPNIFTPNGDTINAYFTLAPVNFTTFSYLIFNRWGNLVFEGDLTSPKWDGVTNNGKEAEEAVYFYKYSGVALNGEVKEGHGYFHLKR
ncbi:MAG: choice-of-anchor L domain-containing protein [Bacteroidota bacterium]